ncbi:hypothetical protein WJX72_000585 [[Myrmecia] bisecta]|uniref:Enoyl reductase (ER) domain-containing protein n=1 Tax=[Myrmecia] bisecta TaxID=41462 RepID=A0AAW1R3I8_9CHLO
MPSTQTVIEIVEWDPKGFSGLTLRKDKSVPEPKQGEVLVRVLLRPINPADIITIQNAFGSNPPLPAVPGTDGMGKVVRNGPGASKFEEGQRVCAAPWPGAKGEGTWQQYVALQEKDLVAVPDGMSDLAASQFYVNPNTAVGLVESLNIPPGEFLLQTAASSAVGHMVIGYAKHKGIKTINIVRNEQKAPELTALGATEVLSSSDAHLVDRVKQITGGKCAYGAIDAVAGNLGQQVFSSIRVQGSHLVYGAMGGDIVPAPIMDLFSLKHLTGFIMNMWLATLGNARDEMLNQVMHLLAKGVLKPATGAHLLRPIRPINPTDLFSIHGDYPLNPPLPAVPGSDGVAKVERNGPGASKFKEGQRVVAAPWPTFQGEGTWQQYVAVAEKHLVAVPDSVSDQAASQFFVNPNTAVGLIDSLKIPDNEYLLQTAATSALGRMIIAYAKHKGIKTINVMRNNKKVNQLKALGADEVIISSEENLVERVRHITGGKGKGFPLEKYEEALKEHLSPGRSSKVFLEG